MEDALIRIMIQALESEVDGRRQTEISGGKITFSLRMANMVSRRQ